LSSGLTTGRREMVFYFRYEPDEIDWLCVEVATTYLDAAATIALKRMRCQRDNRRGGNRWIGFDALGDLPPIHLSESNVHQNEVGLLITDNADAFRAIFGAQDFIARAQKSTAEHIAVKFIIFNDEDTRRRFHCITRLLRG
jgi:hypothetical protein